MITIVIADDEKLIRAGIKKILVDNMGDDLNILEARNGKEALELCQNEQPYVVVTDIRMPGMDGIEFMENVSKLPEKPAIIVLSGFDDFTYAKSAITNGALAYILKPVDTNELIEAVNKALSSVKNEEKQKKEQRLRSIISDGHLNNDDLMFNYSDFKDGFHCVTITGPLHSCQTNFVDEISPCYVLDRKKGILSILVSKQGVKSIEEKEIFQDFVIGISQSSSNLTDLRKLSYQAFSIMLQSFFKVDEDDKKLNGIYYFSDENLVSDFSELDTRWEKVIAALDLLSEEEVRKTIENMFNFSELRPEQMGETLHYLYGKITNNLFKRYPKFNNNDTYLYLKSLMIENIDQAETFAEWKRYVVDYVLYLVELLRRQQGKYPYITKAIAYISKHFSEDITMATVANSVSMNYTWFSEKFKEQVGLNFNDYLKKFRMEQAKQLLEKGTYKVYEVAVRCGFKDVKHFMKSFREMNGMSAGEWARTHGNN